MKEEKRSAGTVNEKKWESGEASKLEILVSESVTLAS